jgi:hypothetical protein
VYGYVSLDAAHLAAHPNQKSLQLKPFCIACTQP